MEAKKKAEKEKKEAAMAKDNKPVEKITKKIILPKA
eukprot:CAMPEP_0176342350 /NCGR_PEP_ID=MMETSP0126-20121128/3098_1 /TAXON_ID=141414 ORGANISM="Strombidinopsis acuminatum, Strain SPMC142" /NCGR_SAMPLE_ID=MMETSP0126 /ASSEMBLY_ACC=CAM_ASM_000229 /LENGTH=35 /DNA_ID= /DNA_START= /DNA_END= /DNA_ORIENTATION=